MRNPAVIIGLTGLLSPQWLNASDFEETRQEVQDSALHASMRGASLTSPTNPDYRRYVDIAMAHVNCVKVALSAGAADTVAKTCTVTRSAYAALLPKEFAEFELNLMEQALIRASATTSANE